MRKKLVPLIAIAFVVAVLSTAVFYTLLADRLSGAPQHGGAARPNVVVAARDLAAGTVVSKADLGTVPWTGDVPKGAFLSPGQVAGKTILEVISQGEPILETRLAGKDGAGLGVPEGMRAVSVHVSDSSGVVGMLKPGYKVDVQVFAWRSVKGPKDEMKTLLRGVAVLAVSPQSEPSSQGYFSAPVVTLLARAVDAEELALADSYARLRLTLRNPLEPATGVAASVLVAARTEPKPSTPAVRDAGVRLRVQAISLTGEGLAALAGSLGPRIGWQGMSVVAVTGPDPLAGLLQAAGYARKEAESVVVVPLRQPCWFDLPQDRQGLYGRVRVLFVPLADATGIRVRPEITGVWGGRTETHSVETEWRTDRDRTIVISGLDAGDHVRLNPKSRHLVLVVAPEPKPAV